MASSGPHTLADLCPYPHVALALHGPSATRGSTCCRAITRDSLIRGKLSRKSCKLLRERKARAAKNNTNESAKLDKSSVKALCAPTRDVHHPHNRKQRVAVGVAVAVADAADVAAHVGGFIDKFAVRAAALTLQLGHD